MSIFNSFKKLGEKINLSGFFESQGTGAVGIDIGSSSIKAVQIRKEKEKAVLETYGELSLSRYGGVSEGQAVRLPDEKIIAAIADLRKEAGIKTAKAIVSIPLKYSFLTTVSLPIMSDREIEKAIPYEIKRYIPVPVSEVIFDWQILPTRAEKISENKVNILLVAIYKDIVEKYQNIIKESGFNEINFEIEVFSGMRSIVYKEPKTILIIDFGALKTKMSIIENGVFKSAYDFEKGSQELTTAVSRSLNIDFERAEIMKKDTGLSIRPEHKEIMSLFEPILNYIFFEAGHLINEYRKKENVSISKVYLTGGGALLKGIDDYAINKLGLEVQNGNGFIKIEYPAFLESVLKEIGPIFSNSAGLALSGI